MKTQLLAEHQHKQIFHENFQVYKENYSDFKEYLVDQFIQLQYQFYNFHSNLKYYEILLFYFIAVLSCNWT